MGGCSAELLGARADAQDSAPPANKRSAPHTTSTAPAPAAQAQASGQVSREQLIALMVDPKIREETPEQAQTRLAPIGEFTRSSMFPDQLDLRSELPQQRVVVEFVKGKNGLQFAHMRVALWVPAGAELKAAYDAADAQLSKSLGKPKWNKKVPDALPNRSYAVGKKLLLVLGEGLEKGKSFVRLELSEAQGDR